MRAMPYAVVTLVLVLAACEQAPDSEARRLAVTYESAASEFDVPKPLLESIGYVVTRWRMRPGVPANDGCYGTMHLCDWGDDGPLATAARLIGVSREALRTDREANIRGAAALMRAQADRYFAETPHLSDTNPADWWQVVMRWSNATDARVADMFATDVFQVLNRGARGTLEDGSVFELAPRIVDVSREKLFGEMSSPLAPDYAGATWYAAAEGNYTQGRGGTAIDRIVIHTAQGYYSGTIATFQNPSRSASAQYVIRSSDGDVAQMVENADTAWHAGHWATNQRSIGIEHEGFVDDPSYLTDALYNASAALTRWLCDTYDIPKDRQHIIGHNEVPSDNPNCAMPFGGYGCHSDPCITLDGSQCHWNWTRYMQLVGETVAPTSGLIRGVVYSSEGGCHFDAGWQNCETRVAGARVFIPESGDTVLSDANGYFELALPFGTYTPRASASGFQDADPVLGPRTLDAETLEGWSSFILQKIEASAVVKGFVYGIDPENEADLSQRIDGALVSAGGSNVVSAGVDGSYRLTVAAGEVTVTATSSGWRPATKTVTIPAGTERTVNLGLVEGGLDIEPPGITFTRPAPNATVTTSPVLVQGTVSEPVASLTVGGVAVTVDEALTWSVELPLDPGVNELVAVATDEAGNEGELTLTVTLALPGEGLDGAVKDLATGEAVTGAVVSAGDVFDTSDDEGRYSLDLEPGPHAMTVQKEGYLAKSFDAEVVAGERVDADVLLMPAEVELLAITSPAKGVLVTSPQLEVRGTVHLGPAPTVRLGGVTAEVTGTSFVAVVPLVPGDNVLSAVARTVDGRSASATIRVLYKPSTDAAAEDGCGCAGAGPGSGLGALLLALAMRRRR